MVGYLFSLGELGIIGHTGSENGGYPLYLTHEIRNYHHWLGHTEREIFTRIAFIDYGYFYDLDDQWYYDQWYYIVPGPFRIKISLMHIYYATNEGEEREFNYLQEIEHKIA